MKTKIEIKSRHDSELVLFTHEIEDNTMKITAEEAVKQGANLQDADLEGVNLRGANLEGVNLRWANLRGANLIGANLQGANLQDTIFDGTKWTATDKNTDTTGLLTEQGCIDYLKSKGYKIQKPKRA